MMPPLPSTPPPSTPPPSTPPSQPVSTGARYAQYADAPVVITGAASGIGAATVREFAVEGARVALLDVNGAAADVAARSIRADTGACTLAVQVDVADFASVQRAVDIVGSAFGPVRVLVNSAVSFIAAGRDATTEQWERSLGVNVRGSAQLTALCSAHMGPGAAIVNVASVSAHIAQPDRWTYNATKGAIVSMTRCQALDLAPRGIRVNAVSPGWIWTPEVAKAAGGDRAAHEPAWGRFHILRRLGEAREVARAILFVCSDDASFITGSELMVDGGYSALSAEGLGERSSFAGSA